MLSAERLRGLLDYDPGTGVLTWRITRGGWVRAGQTAGCRNRSSGYWVIRFDGRLYPAHHLAWLYMTGEWPSGNIDHRDTDPSNNRWHNLRLAAVSQNAANRGAQKNNASGFKGVSWYARERKWVAELVKDRQRVYRGYFDCPAQAHAAYGVAAREHFGEYARIA